MNKTSWNKGNTKIDWSTEKDKIKKLLEEKKTFKEIGNIYGVSASNIWRGLKEYNLKENFTPFKNRSRWTEEEINKIREYLKEEKTYEEIGSLLPNHSTGSIRSLVEKQGNKYNLFHKPTRHYFTDEDIENIKKLSKEGFSPTKIAEKLDLNISSTPKLMKKLGINKVDHKADGFFRNHINPLLTKESIERLLINENKSPKEIAELAGVSVDSVNRRIKKLNIQRPKKKEKPISEGRKHKIEILTSYLGREPSKEEINKPLRDIFKKEDIEKCYAENNYNVSLASEFLKIDECTFRELMKYNNIQIHYKTKATDYPNEFYENCIKSGMSYQDISEQTGLSSETIRKYIGKKLPKLKIRGEYVSSGENLVANVLKSFNIKFKYNDLYYINNTKIYIDFLFIIDNQKYWVEYNGKQHYIFVEYFYKTQERFKKQLERDNLVREYAKSNGIILIELKYSDFDSTSKINEYFKTIFSSTLYQDESLITNKKVIEVDKDILEKFRNSDYNKQLIYIYDSNNNTIITIKEVCKKYNISETSARRWSDIGKHGLISIYKPRKITNNMILKSLPKKH